MGTPRCHKRWLVKNIQMVAWRKVIEEECDCTLNIRGSFSRQRTTCEHDSSHHTWPPPVNAYVMSTKSLHVLFLTLTVYWGSRTCDLRLLFCAHIFLLPVQVTSRIPSRCCFHLKEFTSGSCSLGPLLFEPIRDSLLVGRLRRSRCS